MINLYKVHILSFIEYRTPALFHVSHSVLVLLNMIQNRFLAQLGISVEEAAIHLKLLPLRQKRQIAALGIIQRAVFRKRTQILLDMVCARYCFLLYALS